MYNFEEEFKPVVDVILKVNHGPMVILVQGRIVYRCIVIKNGGAQSSQLSVDFVELQ